MAAAGDCEFAKGKNLGAHFTSYIYNVKTAGSGFVANFRTTGSSILRRASLLFVKQEASQQYIGSVNTDAVVNEDAMLLFVILFCIPSDHRG
jgi:hypothetical protein